jgi:tRNA(fMet)-specific endonuclease VapC
VELIDTSVLIGLERRRLPPAALALVAPGARLGLAAVTAAELLVGVHLADTTERRARRSTFVEALLAALPVVPFDLAAARRHADLAAHLTRAGTPVGAYDLLIGATALAGGWAVLTADPRGFGRLPGLTMRAPVWPPSGHSPISP